MSERASKEFLLELGWNWMTFKFPPNPNHYMILYLYPGGNEDPKLNLKQA